MPYIMTPLAGIQAGYFSLLTFSEVRHAWDFLFLSDCILVAFYSGYTATLRLHASSMVKETSLRRIRVFDLATYVVIVELTEQNALGSPTQSHKYWDLRLMKLSSGQNQNVDF